MKKWLGCLGLSLLLSSSAMAGEVTVIAAFGDSITAGAGLKPTDSFAAQLEQKLVYDGYPDVKVINDGVGGNTTADALARVQSVILQHPKMVVIQFGTNDYEKKVPPAEVKKNLEEILDRFKREKIQIFLAGCKPPSNMGTDYVDAFNAAFADVASEYNAVFYPNFLEGVEGIMGFMQADGVHPTRDGTALIATAIGGKIEYYLKK
jgi:acyl-CoA thioesterase-1